MQSLFGPLEIERDISLGESLFERLHRIVEQFNNVELLQPVGQCADIGERSYRSSISFASVATSARNDLSDAGVGARMPSSSASISPASTASGVRSSWEISAMN